MQKLWFVISRRLKQENTITIIGQFSHSFLLRNSFSTPGCRHFPIILNGFYYEWLKSHFDSWLFYNIVPRYLVMWAFLFGFLHICIYKFIYVNIWYHKIQKGINFPQHIPMLLLLCNTKKCFGPLQASHLTLILFSYYYILKWYFLNGVVNYIKYFLIIFRRH